MSPHKLLVASRVYGTTVATALASSAHSLRVLFQVRSSERTSLVAVGGRDARSRADRQWRPCAALCCRQRVSRLRQAASGVIYRAQVTLDTSRRNSVVRRAKSRCMLGKRQTVMVVFRRLLPASHLFLLRRTRIRIEN